MNLENFKKYLQVFKIHSSSPLVFNMIMLKESTIHGIRYWVDGENWLHRVVWVFLVLCSVAFLSQLVRDAYV